MTKRQFTIISKALADPRRFEILRQIAGCTSEASCADLKEKFPIAPATLSHHLKELSSAGLISTRHNSKFMYLSFRREAWDSYLKYLQKIGG